MLNPVAITLHNGCSSAKAHHNHVVEVCLITCAETVGNKLFRLVGGQSIDGFVDVGTADTGEHHLFHILKLNMIVVQILSERTIQRCHGVCSPDAYRREHLAFFVNSNYLRGADAHIYAYYDSHLRYVLLNFLQSYIIIS